LHEDDVVFCDSSIIEHEEAALLLLKSRRSTLRGLVFQIDQLTHQLTDQLDHRNNANNLFTVAIAAVIATESHRYLLL
jgi:hypothetical protein